MKVSYLVLEIGLISTRQHFTCFNLLTPPAGGFGPLNTPNNAVLDLLIDLDVVDDFAHSITPLEEQSGLVPTCRLVRTTVLEQSVASCCRKEKVRSNDLPFVVLSLVCHPVDRLIRVYRRIAVGY